jgi:UDP-glucose 4-epimerase
MSDAATPTLAGRRALVTGGAGAVGSHIVDSLLHAGVTEVRVLDLPGAAWEINLAWARTQPALSLLPGDVRDRVAVEDAMEGVDVVFHEAAIPVTHAATDARLAHEVMADGTFNVVAAAAAAGTRVVAASSAVVYGADASGTIREDARSDHADSVYGALKAFQEDLLQAFGNAHGMTWVALRYFNVYGPRTNVRGDHAEVLVRWIDRIERGEAPIVDGDGEQQVDLVFVEDVAAANQLAATTSATGRAFNVGTGRGTSMNELAAVLLRVMGSNVGVEHGPARAVNAARSRVADPSQAERELGFRAHTELEDGLVRLVTWWHEVSRPLQRTSTADRRAGPSAGLAEHSTSGRRGTNPSCG